MQRGSDSRPQPDQALRYTITLTVTPGCARLEVTKPCLDQGGWITLIDAIADRWGSHGSFGGDQTFWAELDWPSCTPKEDRS